MLQFYFYVFLSLFTSKKKKKEVLYKCLEELNNIPSINSGGCLIASWAIYKYLCKHKCLSHDFRIVCLNIDTDETRHLYESNYNYIKNSKGRPTGSYHFAVKMFGNFYDSTKLHFFDEYDLKLIFKPRQYFFKKAYFYGLWNAAFSKKYITNIEDNLQIKFY